jgi:hypothetical protein
MDCIQEDSAYFKKWFECEEQPVPSMYTSWAVPKWFDNKGMILNGNVFYKVESIQVRESNHQILIHLTNMKKESKILVCNNSPMVFHQMLNLHITPLDPNH